MTSEPNRNAIASRADAARSAQCGRRAVARTGTTRPSRVTTLSASHSFRACMAPYCARTGRMTNDRRASALNKILITMTVTMFQKCGQPEIVHVFHSVELLTIEEAYRRQWRLPARHRRLRTDFTCGARVSDNPLRSGRGPMITFGSREGRLAATLRIASRWSSTDESLGALPTVDDLEEPPSSSDASCSLRQKPDCQIALAR
jgi:hypothetical protein